jgi:uncharacterized protein YjbI with pentapeptide repeats
VADLVQGGEGVPIQIIGGPGSGKTSALRHLASVLADWFPPSNALDFIFLDEPRSIEETLLLAKKGQVILTYPSLSEVECWPTLQISSWEEDDLLEYLRSRYPARCGDILAALRQTRDAEKLEGIPELWTMTLDYLATHDVRVVPVLAALRLAFLDKVRDEKHLQFALKAGLAHELKMSKLIKSYTETLSVLAPEVLSLLRHVPMRQVLAVEASAGDLDAGAKCLYLADRLARPVLQLLAERISELPKALAQVKNFLTQKVTSVQPTAASIQHQLDRQWLRKFPVTESIPLPEMTGSYLDHANWPEVNLAGAKLSMADLSFANLEGASLEEATAWRTTFHAAKLARVQMNGFAADEAVFSQADLQGVRAVAAKLNHTVFQRAKLDDALFHRSELRQADFTGASLVKASFTESIFDKAILADTDCTDANFSLAQLAGTDFRSARINGAVWHYAQLTDGNFEGLSATRANFSDADLTNALFTDTALPHANFSGADLRGAGLANIDWEEANLNGADLRGASFHLGSSRSGLVGSPIAREGSMTGFYTDDYSEQEFKSPEEIRKANLRGADLRGANIEGVDFYLVDLREALYDPEQADQFRASGAILHYPR